MTITPTTSPRQRFLQLCVALLMALSGAVGVSVAAASPAHALCAAQPMAGNWSNIDPNTRALTRVNVVFVCDDVRRCDSNGNCTGGQSYFTLRPFGKCSPTDCDWGTKRAISMGDGWERATYGYSWATKYVWVKTYVFSGRTYLRVYTFTDFTAADGRTDYTTDEWMLK